MLPLEITRASISNWSDTEQMALGVAIKQGAAACATHDAQAYRGVNLIGLARLCSLGQAWPAVLLAATKYIQQSTQEPNAPTPLLAEAYADTVQAQLNLKNEAEALVSTLSMLKSQPYNVIVADSTNQAIDYMKLIYTMDALTIAKQRQNKILAALQGSPFPADRSAANFVSSPPVPDLYQQGLALSELQMLAGEEMESIQTISSLEAALPKTLQGDDRLKTDAMRRRHALLGHPLVALFSIASLRRPGTIPKLPAQGAITALLLFPDWCAQCIAMAQQMPESVFTVAGHEAYVYGLLAQTTTPQRSALGKDKKESPADKGYNPAFAAEYLKETPTVTVPPTLLETFNALTVPLLIVTDAHGIVRLIQPADEAALQPGKTIDSAIALIAERYPSAKLAAPEGKRSAH